MNSEIWKGVNRSSLLGPKPSRRSFLKFTGMGLVVAFAAGWMGESLAFAQGQAPPLGALPWSKDSNAYIHIKPDGRVAVMVGRVELGQGAKTAFAQLVADELDVSFDSVDMLMGDTDLCPWDMGTVASLSMRVYGPLVRGAAAEVRAVLLQMAAEKLQVPADKLQVKDGVVSVVGSPSKNVSYAKLVDGKKIERHLENVPFKKVTQFKVVGTSAPRRDALEKVTGQAKYTGDMTLPGMVFARILRPPAHGAKLKSLDSGGLSRIPGAALVRDGDFIAVTHPKLEMANQALDSLKPEYELPPPGVDDVSIFEYLVKKFTPQLKVAKESGNLEEGAKLVTAALGSSGRGISENTYTTAYGYHAFMEPGAALAQMENGKMTVWATTQSPFACKALIAKTLGLPPDKVRVIVPYVGGGFGGKKLEISVEAARLAKLTGKPVKLMWTRGEDIFRCNFRPAATMKIRSGLDAAGRISLWEYQVYGAGDWGAVTRYDFPNQRVSSIGHPVFGSPEDMHPFGVGPWRMPCVNSNAFAVESQMDMLASLAGVDPVEFRLHHLTDKRMRRVLETVAKRFNWKPGKAPSGRGVGVACAAAYDSYMFGNNGTYVASMAEVDVDRNTGNVQVKRVATAIDAGLIVNPVGARQQVEGCITMGLGYPLTEELHFKDGEIFTTNFDSYELPRFSSLPKMDITFIDNPNLDPEGLGEPPIITMGAVLANAMYDATGVRMKHLPMTPERIKAALKKA